jgi:quercetin dioxygenase-like cupin family protein
VHESGDDSVSGVAVRVAGDGARPIARRPPVTRAPPTAAGTGSSHTHPCREASRRQTCQNGRMMLLRRPLTYLALAAASLTTASAAQPARQGVTYRAPSGVTLRLILDENNVGKDVSLGEMTFPAGIDSGDHTHGAIEIFYVVSGTLEHVVNGKSEMLEPGMVGYVKMGDTVRHKTGPGGPVKAMVVWVPGAEGAKIAARWKREP